MWWHLLCQYLCENEPAVIPNNAIVDSTDLHMEIIDASTREVWQGLQPATGDEYRALELEPPFSGVGIGRGAMDESYFRRSPGADADGPMRTMRIGERVFSLCARPLGAATPAGEKGPRQITVDKHHTLIFHSGRRVPLLRLADGSEYVHTIDGGPDKEALLLPDGWLVRSVEIDETWTVDLPAPTTAFFFRNGDSFQGPLTGSP